MEKYAAGKEVLSYCNKCKLTLMHTIEVMKDANTIGKVQCNTCKGIHAYKDPSAATVKKTVSAGKKKGRPTTKKVEVPISELWLEALNGTNAKSQDYSPKIKFNVGDIIDHKKFGPGIIEKVFDTNKIEVIFRHEIKTLIHNVK